MISSQHTPLVSVTVITYNSSKYVVETLNSIKEQSYKNIELIISDDCSSDDTVRICELWLNENKKSFVETHLLTSPVNTGIPANKNRAILKCKGVWLKSIAGDDTLLPDCITDNMNYIRDNSDIKILLSCTEKYNEVFNKKNFIARIPQNVPADFYSENITAKQQYAMLLRSDRVLTTPTNFIKKEVIQKVGYYDENYKHIEDYPMWLRLTKAGFKLNFMNKVTVNHRAHKNSLNNLIENFIYKPAYFRNEQLRRDLVYPNIEVYDAWRQKTIYYYVFILNKLGLNRSTKINKLIFQIFTRFLNPFAIATWVIKKFKR